MFATPSSITTGGIYSLLRISSATFPIHRRPKFSTIGATIRDLPLVWVKRLSFSINVAFSMPYFVTTSRQFLFSSGAVTFDNPNPERAVLSILCVLAHEALVSPCSSIAFNALAAFISPALDLAIVRSFINITLLYLLSFATFLYSL